MFYTGSAYPFYHDARIFFATSPDGNNWTKTGATEDQSKCKHEFCDGSFSLSAKNWNQFGRLGGASSVVKFGNAYFMLYSYAETNDTIIKLAVSYDLVRWSAINYYGVQPISDSGARFGQIPKGTSGKGDSTYVLNPTVIFDQNKFRIWYTGNSGAYRIYYAEVDIPDLEDPYLVQHYTFDNNSGKSIPDLVYGVGGNVSLDTDLSKGFLNSTSFQSNNEYANTSFNIGQRGMWYLSDKNFSLSLWIKVTSVDYSGSANYNIFYRGNNNSGLHQRLYVRSKYLGGADCYPIFRWDAGSSTTITPNSKSICDGLWHNVVLTREGTSLVLYVDGDPVGNATFDPTKEELGAAPMFGNYLSGGLDEIKLYHRALSAEEVQRDYNKMLDSKFVSGNNSIIKVPTLRKWISFKINEDQNYTHGYPICGANDVNCSPDKFSDGLVALYHLDTNAQEQEILTNADSSGNNNNLFCEFPSIPVPGKWTNSKAQFIPAYAQSYATIPSPSIFYGQKFGISFWFKPSFSSLNSTIISAGGYGGEIRTNGNKLVYNYSLYKGLNGTKTYIMNSWNHVVFTWDGTTYKAYLNNELDASFDYSSAPIKGTLLIASLPHSSYWMGSALDDLVIWRDRSLSVEDVNYIYNLGAEYDNSLDENIYAIYRFDEDFSSTSFIDSSGNNKHARINFNGENYLGGCSTSSSRPSLTTGILDSNGWQMSPTTQMFSYMEKINPTRGTIMFWEKPPVTDNGSRYYLFGFPSITNSLWLSTTLSNLNNGSRNIYMSPTVNSSYTTVTPFRPNLTWGPTPLSQRDKWNFHVLKYDSGTATYYFNGQKANTKGYANFDSLSKIFMMGGGIGYYERNKGFPGVIDEIAIWDRGLSDLEIKEIFEKYNYYMDINVYACEDEDCENKISSFYVSRVKSNEDILFPTDFPFSKYLGYDVYFKSTMINEPVPVALEGIEFKSIGVTQLPANTVPRGKIITLNNKNINTSNEIFSNIQDGNLSLKFEVNDIQNDNIYFTLKYSPNNIDGLGTPIIQDLNLRNTSYCTSNDWNETPVECTIDFNSYQIPDGNYYLKLEFYDGISGDYDTWYNTSTNKIVIDNSPPTLTWDAPLLWKRGKTTITIICTDAVSCQTVQYKINSGTLKNYTAPFVISGDGNYRIDINAIDTKGNATDTNTFFVTIGYDGQLFTYNDTNTPESYFAPGEKTKLIYYSTLTIPPTINLTLPDGNTIQDTMQNISSDPLFGTPDYNTYYYDYTIPTNTKVGWVDINIQNQLLKKKIYVTELWQDSFTDSKGNTFHFGFDLNINENISVDRWFWPIDQKIDFEYPLKPNSIRVLDFNGTNYKEIPSQAYGYQGEGLITSANLAFLSTIGKDQNKIYSIRYSVLDRNTNYDTSITLTNDSNKIKISTSDYNVLVEANKGGLVTEIQSNIGTSTDLNSSPYGLFGPRIQDLLGSTYSMNQIASPAVSLITGPIVTVLTITGSQSIFDFVQKYTFYSNNDFFIVDTNVASRGNLEIDQYNNSIMLFDKAQFSRQVSNENGLYQTNSLSTLPTQPQTDTNIVGVYDPHTLDSFVAFFYKDQGNLALSNSTNISQTGSKIRVDGQSYSGQINSGDVFSSSIAYSFTNPTFIINSVSNLFESLTNPLNILQSTVQSNDPIPPQIQSVIILGADHNDDSNISCAVTFSDDILVEKVVVNFSDTKDTDKNFVTTIREKSGTLLVTLLSDEVNAGTLTCTAYVSDVAMNTVSDNNTTTITDVSGPIIDSLTNSPNTDADLDPNVPVTIQTVLREYTQIDSVSLFYRTKKTMDANWSEWVPKPMTLDSNNTDYNYLYTYTLTPDSGIYEYYITTSDSYGYLTTSETNTINVFVDYTWEVTPTSFGTLPPTPLATNLNVGTFTITNTGDAPISFRISSNWEDKEKIWYNNGTVESIESTTGVSLILDKNSSINYAVRLVTKNNEKRDDLVITLRPTITADPTFGEVSATILSLSSGPFMLLEFPTIPIIVTQGDKNVSIIARLTNVGNEDANTITIDWNYPEDWVLKSGEVSENILGNLTPTDPGIERELIFEIPEDANTGTQQITITAHCCELPDKTQIYTKNIVVVTKGGTIIIDGGGSGGGSSGGGVGGGGSGSGGGGGGGGLPFTAPEQKNLFFQTNEFFELVRGQDSSFKIKVTNPLNNSMEDLGLKVEGIISSYLKLKDTNIAKLDSNQEFVTEIEITSPKYFTPGEYQLTFTIEGYFYDTYKRRTSFKEERQINLLIHDTNKETAKKYLEEMDQFVQTMTTKGYKLSSIDDLFNKSQTLYNKHAYDQVKENYLTSKQIYEQAIKANETQQKITNLVNISTRQGISTPNTNRLLALAELAFKRGDYAVALERLKEAELTYSVETKGEFNLLVWALANLDMLILMTILLLIAGYLLYTGIKLLLIKNKLKDLNSENNLLLNLIQDLQKRAFLENKISMGEYYDALVQFEKRIARVSEDIINYTTKKNNTFTFKSPITRLSQEKKGLLETIKETQGLYFNKGLVETRIYKTKIESLTKRLAIVEQNLVSNELQKTLRIHSAGIDKYFWRIYYKIFK